MEVGCQDSGKGPDALIVSMYFVNNIIKNIIIGKSVYDIAPKNLANIYYSKYQELFRKPDDQIYETSVVDADGTRHVLFSINPPWIWKFIADANKPGRSIIWICQQYHKVGQKSGTINS